MFDISMIKTGSLRERERECNLLGIVFLLCVSVCVQMYCVLNTDKILFTRYQRKLDLERQKAFPGQFVASSQRDMKWLTGAWESRGEGRRGHTLKHLQLNKIKATEREAENPWNTYFLHHSSCRLLSTYLFLSFCLPFSPSFSFIYLPHFPRLLLTSSFLFLSSSPPLSLCCSPPFLSSCVIFSPHFSLLRVRGSHPE